ncbi:MAG: shikimate kinase [Eubacteriaceae bacterium]|nr:shikimate kinase [Eubacteriaceae bacterium]
MGKKKVTPIALIGFMGTGKSTIGPLLAEKLGYQFIDTDTMVEEGLGMKISEIFKNQGERCFRDVEHRALKKALAMEKVVISTGGGAILLKENRKLLEENAFVVSLNCQPETIFQRLQGDQSRPLLKSIDPLTEIKKIMANRHEYYEECDFQISTEEWTTKECCQKIIKVYENA